MYGGSMRPTVTMADLWTTRVASSAGHASIKEILKFIKHQSEGGSGVWIVDDAGVIIVEDDEIHVVDMDSDKTVARLKIVEV
jgi:hypothetical protein